MKLFTKIFIVLVISFLFYKCFLKEEICNGLKDTIELRHQLIDSLYNQLDSLHKVIDTLQYENEIFDYDNVSEKEIIAALMYVESSNNDSAYNASEDAVGCLQIRKTMVNDVNRILKRQGKDKRYSYMDRWNREKSIEMFNIFCEYYGLVDAEEIARCWNGGPRGINNPATVRYWEKVKNQING